MLILRVLIALYCFSKIGVPKRFFPDFNSMGSKGKICSENSKQKQTNLNSLFKNKKNGTF